MGLQVGSTDVSNVLVGTTQVQEVRVGTTVVWTNAPPNINFSTTAGGAGWNTAAANAVWDWVNLGDGAPSRGTSTFTVSGDYGGVGQPLLTGEARVKAAVMAQLQPNKSVRCSYISAGCSDEERLIGRIVAGNTTTGDVTGVWFDTDSGSLQSFDFVTPSSGTVTLTVQPQFQNFTNGDNATLQQIYLTYL